MKTKLTVLATLLTLFGFANLAMANENEGLSKVDLDQINAACKEESRDAENPSWYAEECVDERIQALKEEKGLVQPNEES